MTPPVGPVSPITGPDEPQPAQQPAGSLAYALLCSRRFVGATMLLGAVIGLAFGLMRPNSYTSSGTLMLRSGAREIATAESTVAGRESQEARPFDFLANEMQILTHRDAFRRVIDKVGAARILEAYDPAADDSAETSVLARGLHRLQSWWFAGGGETAQAASPELAESLALKRLMTHLTIGPSGSSMIRVGYEANTPELAKEIVDAFLAAAEEHHRQVFSNRTSFEFLTDLEQKAGEAAKAATGALLEFKQKHGIFDMEGQRSAAIGDVARLEVQLASDEDQLLIHESRCESLTKALAGEKPFEEVVTEVPPREDPERVALQQQLSALRSEGTSGDGTDRLHAERRAKALHDVIATVEHRLATLPPTIAKSTVKAKNPRYERLRGLLDEDELSVAALRVTRDREAARLEKMRAWVRDLDQTRPCYDSLVEEVARHESDSQRFQESLKKTELLDLLDDNKLSNLRIAEPGDLPVQKSGPNRALRTMLGGAFGLMVGACLALLRHRLTGAVRRAQDLESAGVEVLGVVPDSKAVAAHELCQDAGPDDPRHRPLRQRLDGLWASLLPPRITRDFRCTIAMVGDEHSPGVTTLALHFAERAARCHHLETLLIETNCHHPTLAARQRLDAVPGLDELIAGTAGREDVVRPTMVPRLHVVHAGRGDAASGETAAGGGPAELLRSLSEGFQVVVLDVPSIVEHPEFRQLVWCADVVVPVFAAGRSTREGARALMHAIECDGKRTPGAILNCWRSVRPFWLPRSLDV